MAIILYIIKLLNEYCNMTSHTQVPIAFTTEAVFMRVSELYIILQYNNLYKTHNITVLDSIQLRPEEKFEKITYKMDHNIFMYFLLDKGFDD